MRIFESRWSWRDVRRLWEGGRLWSNMLKIDWGHTFWWLHPTIINCDLCILSSEGDEQDCPRIFYFLTQTHTHVLAPLKDKTYPWVQCYLPSLLLSRSHCLLTTGLSDGPTSVNTSNILFSHFRPIFFLWGEGGSILSPGSHHATTPRLNLILCVVSCHSPRDWRYQSGSRGGRLPVPHSHGNIVALMCKESDCWWNIQWRQQRAKDHNIHFSVKAPRGVQYRYLICVSVYVCVHAHPDASSCAWISSCNWTVFWVHLARHQQVAAFQPQWAAFFFMT